MFHQSSNVFDFESTQTPKPKDFHYLIEEMVINYTCADLGRQIMILDIGAPVSIAGVSWMKQYLEEFDLEIEDMKSVSCN